MWDNFRELFHSRRPHGRLLTVWSTVHYGSAILAICMFLSLIQCGVALALEWTVRPGCASREALLVEFACLGLYAFTFYRFHRGDLTYLNWVYRAFRASPVADFLDAEESRKLKWDMVALILRALAFLALANSIMDPTFFFFFYALLLLVDIPWLFSRYRRSKARLTRCAETLFRWLVNNLFTLLVLAALTVLRVLGWIEAKDYLWLNVFACFTNSVVDVVMTRWVYRPRRK
jgi:hypothetical protein